MGNCLSSKEPSKGGARAHTLAAIRDRFETIEEVQQALKESGLESSELVVCIDFTKSNESNGKCLHDQSNGTNPYLQVVSVLCQTLAKMDDDQKISTYGFGDSLSRNHSLFSFAPKDQPMHTLESVLQRYSQLVPSVKLSGPTSFAPAVNKAMDIVRQSDGRFHILLLIADGQVVPGQCMEDTKRAIVEASRYPLAIIMIGVGDGKLESLTIFNSAASLNSLKKQQGMDGPQRSWKLNLQFQCAPDAVQKWALMELPDQYAIILERGRLGKVPDQAPPKVKVFDPPGYPYTLPGGQQPLC